MHGGRHVRHPRAQKDGDGERFPGCREQGDKGVPKVQCDAEIYGVQLGILAGFLSLCLLGFLHECLFVTSSARLCMCQERCKMKQGKASFSWPPNRRRRIRCATVGTIAFCFYLIIIVQSLTN